MLFSYTAKNERGEAVKGRVEAPSKEQASVILRNRWLLVISVEPIKNDAISGAMDSLNAIKRNEIVNFTRQLSTMITAGLTLTESLHILQQQSQGTLEKMIGDVLREVEGGNAFAKALESQGSVFPQVYIQLIRAGETAGALDGVLNRLADNMEKQREFQAKVKGALIYPSIVLTAMVAVGFIMLVFVVPKLTDMYKDMGAKLPFITQALIDVSGFMARFWVLILAVAAALAFAYRTWYKTPSGRLTVDRTMLKIPVMGAMNEKVILTEFCRTVSLLLGSGISVLQSLEIIAASTDNKLYSDAFREMTHQVEKGIPLSQAVGQYPFIPPIIAQMISVGEETGKIDDVMLKLSLYFESESEHAVKNLTAAFEPLIMVVLGLGVGVLVMAIIMPMYNLTSNIQ